MKIPSILAILIPCIPISVAAEEAPRAVLNFISVIPGDARCMVTLDGKGIHPEGLAAGKETGWFSIPGGKMKISATYAGCKPLAENFESAKYPAQVCVFYLRTPVAVGKKVQEKVAPQIGFSIFPAFVANSAIRKVVSLCPEENKILVGSKETSLKFLEITDAPQWEVTGFKVSNGTGEIGEVRETVEGSNYYLFVSKGMDGSFFVSVANADRLDSSR